MSDIQVTMSGSAFPTGNVDGALSPFSLTFTVDTTNGAPQMLYSGGCLTGFRSTPTVTNFNASVGGSLFSLPSAAAGIGGDVPVVCGSELLGQLNIPGVFTWTVDPPVPATFGSDPIAALISNWNTDAGTWLNGWTLLPTSIEQHDVTPVSVPEPSLIVLFALGLAALLINRRMQR